MEEKRKFTRYNTNYTALYCQYNKIRAVKIHDLSRAGAALEFKDDINAKVGMKAILHFFSRDTNSLVARLECKVIRIFNIDVHTAIGVKFEASNKAIDSIIEFFEKHNI